MKHKTKRAGRDRSQAPAWKPPYDRMMVGIASDTQPMKASAVRTYLVKIHQAFARLRDPCKGGTRNDWEDVSDCINFIERAREKGVIAEESNALIAEAARAMRDTQDYYKTHRIIHVKPEDVAPVRDLLDDYESMIAQMSAKLYMQTFNEFALEIYEARYRRKKRENFTEVAFD